MREKNNPKIGSRINSFLLFILVNSLFAHAIFLETLLAEISCPLSIVENLQIENQTTPINIEHSHPVFNWHTASPSENIKQYAYQLQVASQKQLLDSDHPDLWDSNQVISSNNFAIQYKGKKFLSNKTYFWRVKIWTNVTCSTKYFDSFFETAITDSKEWTAEWIWGKRTSETSEHLYFAKIFNVDSLINPKLKIHVSASHFYELYVDGKLQDKGQAISPVDYKYYRTVNLSLNPKRKTHYITIVAHWLGTGQSRPASVPGLYAQISLTDATGRSLNLSTDQDWYYHEAEWYEVAPFDRGSEGVRPENIDLRKKLNLRHPENLEISSWKKVFVLDEKYSPTKKFLAQQTAIKEKIIQPKFIKKNQAGNNIFDVGKVYAGSPIIEFNSQTAGEIKKILTGYRLDQNNNVINPVQRTDTSYTFITKKGRNIFSPFWYLGLRYLELPGSLASQDILKVDAKIRHLQEPGPFASFASSSERLNQIWNLIVHSARFSAQEQFIDTPTREQGQFAYDSYLIGMSNVKLFSERNLNRQVIKEFAASQKDFTPADGRINAVAPNGSSVQEIADWSMSWIWWIEEFYQTTGDVYLLKEIYPNVLKFGGWLKHAIDNKNGLFKIYSESSAAQGLIDWPDRYEYDLETEYNSLMSLNTYLTFITLAKISKAVEDGKNNKIFQDYAQKIKKNILELLWDSKTNLFCDGLYKNGSKSEKYSQQANAMALALGFVPEEYLSNVLDYVAKKDFNTSVILSRFLVKAFGDFADARSLYNYLLNPNGHNLSHIIQDGGTFTYESWLGRLNPPEKGDSESHGYGAYTGVLAIQNYTLGVLQTSPGFKTFRIKPLPGNLGWAKGEIPTVQGEIIIDWKNTLDNFKLQVSIPANSEAEIFLPNCSVSTILAKNKPSGLKEASLTNYKYIGKYGSGKYSFSCTE